MNKVINEFLSEVNRRNSHEPEFMQAVSEVASTVLPHIVSKKIYHGKNILLRMVESERVIMFRVPWVDDCKSFSKENKNYKYHERLFK